MENPTNLVTRNQIKNEGFAIKIKANLVTPSCILGKAFAGRAAARPAGSFSLGPWRRRAAAAVPRHGQLSVLAQGLSWSCRGRRAAVRPAGSFAGRAAARPAGSFSPGPWLAVPQPSCRGAASWKF